MLSSSPPQRLPPSIPIKITIIVKLEISARRMMGRGKRRKPFFSLPPSHRSPALSFSFSPVSLQHKEAPTEERGWSRLRSREIIGFSKRLCHEAGAHNWKRTIPKRHALLTKILLLRPILSIFVIIVSVFILSIQKMLLWSYDNRRISFYGMEH